MARSIREQKHGIYQRAHYTANYLSLGTADQVPFFQLWYNQSNIEVDPCVASEVQFSELCT
jgi:hypothetical protein